MKNLEPTILIQEGVDFVGKFDDHSHYEEQHQPGFCPFDPESVITGAEIQEGFTFTNSKRIYSNLAWYEWVTKYGPNAGFLARVFPRRFLPTIADYPEVN
jgi:hypothetical protein